MNKQEAKRYAHKLVADAAMSIVRQGVLPHSADAPKVIRALGHIQETHARLGPRTGDKAPRQPEYKGEKFSFDAPLKASGETCSACGQQKPICCDVGDKIENRQKFCADCCPEKNAPDHRDSGEQICRCNDRFPAPDGTACKFRPNAGERPSITA